MESSPLINTEQTISQNLRGWEKRGGVGSEEKERGARTRRQEKAHVVQGAWTLNSGEAVSSPTPPQSNFMGYFFFFKYEILL